MNAVPVICVLAFVASFATAQCERDGVDTSSCEVSLFNVTQCDFACDCKGAVAGQGADVTCGVSDVGPAFAFFYIAPLPNTTASYNVTFGNDVYTGVVDDSPLLGPTSALRDSTPSVALLAVVFESAYENATQGGDIQGGVFPCVVTEAPLTVVTPRPGSNYSVAVTWAPLADAGASVLDWFVYNVYVTFGANDTAYLLASTFGNTTSVVVELDTCADYTLAVKTQFRRAFDGALGHECPLASPAAIVALPRPASPPLDAVYIAFYAGLETASVSWGAPNACQCSCEDVVFELTWTDGQGAVIGTLTTNETFPPSMFAFPSKLNLQEQYTFSIVTKQGNESSVPLTRVMSPPGCTMSDNMYAVYACQQQTYGGYCDQSCVCEGASGANSHLPQVAVSCIPVSGAAFWWYSIVPAENTTVAYDVEVTGVSRTSYSGVVSTPLDGPANVSLPAGAFEVATTLNYTQGSGFSMSSGFFPCSSSNPVTVSARLPPVDKPKANGTVDLIWSLPFLTLGPVPRLAFEIQLVESGAVLDTVNATATDLQTLLRVSVAASCTPHTFRVVGRYLDTYGVLGPLCASSYSDTTVLMAQPPAAITELVATADDLIGVVSASWAAPALLGTCGDTLLYMVSLLRGATLEVMFNTTNTTAVFPGAPVDTLIIKVAAATMGGASAPLSVQVTLGPPPHHHHGRTKGATVGTAMGAWIGAVVAIAAAVLIVRAYRRRRATQAYSQIQ